jgi:hypothetical protein
MRRIVVLTSVGLMVVSVVPTMRAQSCFGNGGVAGSYGFVGSRFITAAPPSTSGPGSTGSSGTSGTGSATTTPIVSNTPIGQVIGGIAGISPFALVGAIGADGAGNLLAAPNTAESTAQVGSYSVNPDCTISVTLTDAFVGVPVTAPGTSGASNTGGMSGGGSSSGSATPPAPVSVKLEGLVLDGGAEIDLAQTGTSDTGAVITLRRALQSVGTCTDINVNGPFGLVARSSVASAGSSGGTNTTLTPVVFIGRFVADGAGTFSSDALGSQSPHQELQLTGTYAVNGNCSGTAQFVDSTGAAHHVDFVIVQAESRGPTQTAISPELVISITDQGITGFGVAKQE